MDISTFFPVIYGALGGATSAGVFKGPIQTLEDWWFSNFGYSQSEKANMLRVKQEANIEALKRQLLDDVSKINPENVKEPKLNILGPALEASRYYIEEESLRNMFSKLIAASMDKSKDDITRSSFVELIKQMEPIDAENLLCIIDKSNPLNTLICSLRVKYSSGGYSTQFSNIYLGNPNVHEQKVLGISLVNLARLGLIEITYQESRNKEGAYLAFEQTDEFKQTQNFIEGQNILISVITANNPNHPHKNMSLSGPEIGKGIIQITNLGEAFCSICL